MDVLSSSIDFTAFAQQIHTGSRFLTRCSFKGNPMNPNIFGGQ